MRENLQEDKKLMEQAFHTLVERVEAVHFDYVVLQQTAETKMGQADQISEGGILNQRMAMELRFNEC